MHGLLEGEHFFETTVGKKLVDLIAECFFACLTCVLDTLLGRLLSFPFLFGPSLVHIFIVEKDVQHFHAQSIMDSTNGVAAELHCALHETN